MLDPAWVRDAEDVDIFHVHFGFDSRSPAALRELVAELRRRGIPLVYTVHDLRNPHHDTTTEHDHAGFDRESLAAAIRLAYAERPDFSASLEARREQRTMLAREHARIYSELLS